LWGKSLPGARIQPRRKKAADAGKILKAVKAGVGGDQNTEWAYYERQRERATVGTKEKTKAGRNAKGAHTAWSGNWDRSTKKEKKNPQTKNNEGKNTP